MGLENFKSEEDETVHQDKTIGREDVSEEALQWKEIDVSELNLYFLDKGRGNNVVMHADSLDTAIATVFKPDIIDDLIETHEIPLVAPEEDEEELQKALEKIREDGESDTEGSNSNE